MVFMIASLSSGYADFWSPILQNHPDSIVEMHSSDKGQYNPIILGGVVTGDDGDMSRRTTALTVIVTVKLRYEMVNHQPVTHSITIGKSVGVNQLLDGSTISNILLVMDIHTFGGADLPLGYL